MTRGEGAWPPTDRVPVTQAVDFFLESKLQWPLRRDGWVERRRLLEQLDLAATHQVTLIAAPAGYGKTTLAAQWLARRRATAATAWVSLDPGDNDPGRLWTHVAAALERAGCIVASDLAAFMGANSGDVLAGVLPRMINALAAMPDDITILFDDFYFVRQPACHSQVEFFIEHLPQQAHLVILTRADPGLRLGRLRATGALAEIRTDDLTFDPSEASSLLAVEDVHLSDDAGAQLMQRTEGWAAGIYLAALSLAGRGDPDEFVRQFSGGNRFIGDYLTEEVLSRHPPRLREFITTMSILDRFCAPLCDCVSDSADSAVMLRELERTNMFLVPLDEKRDWYRFHHLFAAVARSELAAERPDSVEALHLRAARWFEDHGQIDEAVTHALSAGSVTEAATLVQANWLTYVDAGRAATVVGWLQALGPAAVASNPAAGVTAAWVAALNGDEPATNDHLRALERFRTDGPLPDGTRSVESAMALIQGLFGFDGPAVMAASAKRATELETDARSPFYAIAHMSLGHSAYVAGDLESAVIALGRVWNNGAAPVIVRVLALSIQSVVDAERGRVESSREFAELAMEIVDAHGLHGVPQVSMAFTAFGQAQAAAGKTADAVATLEHGLALRRKNPARSPWQLTHHLLVMARVLTDAGQLYPAEQLLVEAAQRMDRYHEGMGPMGARLAAARAALRARLAEVVSDEPLTEREVEVLRLLPSSSSLKEIADELYVSPNTVKTHVKALYRKLGAGSRTEAVSRARQRLLL